MIIPDLVDAELHLTQSQVNQAYYPEIAGIVRKTCSEFGVKYRIRDSFIEAAGDHLQLLKKLGTKTDRKYENLK